jgi:hypothetical protein
MSTRSKDSHEKPLDSEYKSDSIDHGVDMELYSLREGQSPEYVELEPTPIQSLSSQFFFGIVCIPYGHAFAAVKVW